MQEKIDEIVVKTADSSCSYQMEHWVQSSRLLRVPFRRYPVFSKPWSMGLLWER